MPSIDANKLLWDGEYDWGMGGEEWSEVWGSSETQWFGCILPRIHPFFPGDRILEIAPGFGRWTRFLLQATNVEYFGIDLSEQCITRCRELFSKAGKAKFFQNDGLSLDAIQDGSCDFVFSFDSLVHAEIDVLRAYIPQIIRKLRAEGVAFIHHSNWLNAGESEDNNLHYRGVSVGYEVVRQIIQENGGSTLIQEQINWGMPSCIDCLSVFGRYEAYPEVETRLLLNPKFMEEASIIQTFHYPYSTL